VTNVLFVAFCKPSLKPAKLSPSLSTGYEMLKSNPKKEKRIENSVSDTTGAYDLRFVLWRHFCAQNNIPVDTLPSQLNAEQKDKWEEMKAKRLR